MKVIDLVQTLNKEELPEKWSFSTITELVGRDGFFSDGDWVESKDQDPEGDVRLIQLADIGEFKFRDKSARFLTYEKARELKCSFLEKGDILIARMPDPLGRACLFPGDEKKSITAVDVAIIRSANDKFNHKWLMYFLNVPAVRAAIESLQSGSTRKRISRKNLARLLLPVPPRKQQDMIVAEIEKQFSRLDEAVTSLKRAKANLKRYKAAVLKAAVEGKLTEEWRKQHPDVEPASELLKRILAERHRKWEEAELAKMRAKGKEPKDDEWKEKYIEQTGVGENKPYVLPPGWFWIKFGQIVQSSQNGLSKRRSKNGEPMHVLRLSDIIDGSIHEASPRDILLTEVERDKYGLKKNDLLCIRVNGAKSLTGRLILFDASGAWAFCDHFIRLNIASGIQYGKLFDYFFDTELVRKQIEADMISSAGQNTVSQKTILDIKVPLQPLHEQQKILEKIESMLSITEANNNVIAFNENRSERLRQSILKEAFSGKLGHRQS